MLREDWEQRFRSQSSLAKQCRIHRTRGQRGWQVSQHLWTSDIRNAQIAFQQQIGPQRAPSVDTMVQCDGCRLPIPFAVKRVVCKECQDGYIREEFYVKHDCSNVLLNTPIFKESGSSIRHCGLVSYGGYGARGLPPTRRTTLDWMFELLLSNGTDMNRRNGLIKKARKKRMRREELDTTLPCTCAKEETRNVLFPVMMTSILVEGIRHSKNTFTRNESHFQRNLCPTRVDGGYQGARKL